MTMRLSVPVEGRASSGSAGRSAQVTRFMRLLYRSLWRSGITPLLPVVVAIGAWYAHLLVGEGVVLWDDVSVSIAMIYAIVGPVSAALVTWSSGRAPRRGLTDQLQSASLPGWQQDLLAFTSAAGIGVIVYTATALVVAGWAATQATWGAPYGVVIISGLWMVVLFCVFGAAVGMWWPHHLSSLVVLGVTGGSVILGNSIQNFGPEANARELTLWNTLLNLRDGFDPWVASRSVPELYENMLLATGATALVITLALVLRHRGPFTVAALMLAIVWATFGGAATMTGERSGPLARWMGAETTATFEYDCRESAVVDVCLHPAWSSVHPLVDEVATEVFTPVAGLDGVPRNITQISNSDPDARGEGTFSMPSGRHTQVNLSFYLVATVFPDVNGDRSAMSDAELVVAGWLQEEAGGSASMLLHFGPRFQETGVTQQQDMRNAIDRFAALSPEEQRVWLEANWDALRAGELTLEDLP